MEELIVKLANLAIRIEGKGQYNIAKYVRATMDSLIRKSAFEQAYPSDTSAILSDLKDVIAELEAIGCASLIVSAIKTGYKKIEDNEISKITEFADVVVCRRCGNPLEVKGNDSFHYCEICGSDIDSFVIHRPIYWMREFDPPEALLHLRKTPLKYEELVAKIPVDEHTVKLHPEGWSVLEVLKHIKDAESVLQMRVKLILTEENPYLDFKKVWDWADKPGAKTETAETLINDYKQSRALTIQMLQETSLQNWWRPALHEEFGSVKLIEQVSYFTAHEISHIRQIVAFVNALPWMQQR
jgi:hypothetical protein